MYQSGQGVEASDEEALKWYRRAAEKDDRHAQCSLGLMYLMSDKVWNLVGWWDALKLPSWFAKFINGERFCTLVSTLICIIINFAGNKLFVFKTKKAQDSAEN